MPPRSKVFLDLQCGTDSLGRIALELFDDKTPRTSENFRALCTSSFTPPSTQRPLTYKRSPFHRVIDGFMVQGGDITAGDGTGGTSIYGGSFADENIGWRKIDRKGLLCMANRGKDTNSSQFFITLAPCEHLNAKHTIFGHVVSGQEVLDRMAKVPVNRKDRPRTDITIARCGELDPRQKSPAPAEVTSRPKPPGHRHRSPRSRRGREAAQRSSTPSSSSSRSPFRSDSAPRSRSRSLHAHPDQRHRRHHHQPRSNRRRSDVAIDETRRGRSLTRSPSPATRSSRTGTARPRHQQDHPPPSPSHHHGSRRKRSPPPSRPHSRPRSRSPHLRRRRTRSRSPRHRDRDRAGDRDGWRRRDEETLRKVEEEREGGRARWDGVLEGSERYRGRDAYQGGGYGRNRGARDVGDLRGGGGGGGGRDGEPAVQFKGRGSMKYRERKW